MNNDTEYSSGNNDLIDDILLKNLLKNN